VPVDQYAHVERPSRWSLAISLWFVAGLAFPFITPTTNFLSSNLQAYLAVAGGMSDELAYRVAFTIVRVPLTVALAVAIAAMQCAVVPAVRPMARRWLVVTATAASVSVLIWLPTTLIAAQIVGETFPEPVRLLLLTFGAGLLAGLASFTQRRTMRRAVAIPQRFVLTGTGTAIVGALGGWAM
jgi:hypothetical protein